MKAFSIFRKIFGKNNNDVEESASPVEDIHAVHFEKEKGRRFS